MGNVWVASWRCRTNERRFGWREQFGAVLVHYGRLMVGPVGEAGAFVDDVRGAPDRASAGRVDA